MAALGDLPGLAMRISRDLERAGIRHALTGAMAMVAHGYVRTTHDIDILIVTSSIQLPRVFEIVRHHGFEGDDQTLIEAIRDRYVATLSSGPVAVEVFVPALPYHETIVDRAVRVDVAGGTIPTVSAADLIVLKMLWHRAKDVPDVHALIATSEALDGAWIRATLADILPVNDPRHDEIADLLRRFGPG